MPSSPVFKFDSPSEHYHADACLVWCFDDRFTPLLNAYAKSEKFAHYDLVRIAGGAKSLADSADSKMREFLLGEVQKSNALHGTNRVILMVHRDCGAYGGSKAFNADASAEYAKLARDLAEAETFLRPRIVPSITIEKYIADFDGLHRA